MYRDEIDQVKEAFDLYLVLDNLLNSSNVKGELSMTVFTKDGEDVMGRIDYNVVGTPEYKDEER